MFRQILQTGCLAAGILCFLYFTIILIHVGHTEWFQFVWLAAGIGFLLLWRILAYLGTYPGSAVRYVAGAMLLLVLLGAAVCIRFGSCVIRGMTAQPEKDLDYVIVLGAQVNGTRPSRALRKRLDRAVAYAQENPDTIFILSGGQGPDEGISEAQCMYEYMKTKGIDLLRLIQEDRSTSTRENLRFSAVFLEKEKDRVGVLSNNFHIYRAMLLAEKEGYRDVAGIPAPSDAIMQIHYVLREICALLVMSLRS